MAYHSLHANPGLNFTLNRLAQTIEPEEVKRFAAKVDSRESMIAQMLLAAKDAEQQGRMHDAARYLHGAEFYMKQGDAGKTDIYAHSINLMNQAFPEMAVARDTVTYLHGQLPVIRLPAVGVERDIILIHSRFDGLVEEMYPILEPLAAAGYTVIAFEGPGQGAALRTSNLTMPLAWEKPVGVILDHYAITSCTLIGMSLGGYLAPRAAAFDKRVKRVVAWGAMFDFFSIYSQRLGANQFKLLSKLMDLGLAKIVNRLINKARQKDAILDWAVSHGMHVSGTNTPYGFLQWVRSLNLRDCAHLIDQDVLLVMGDEDHLVPPDQLYVQAQAMSQARSVTSIMLSARDDAAQHCQVGNVGLAIKLILDWLDNLAHRDIAN